MKKFEEDLLLLEDQNSKLSKVGGLRAAGKVGMGCTGGLMNGELQAMGVLRCAPVGVGWVYRPKGMGRRGRCRGRKVREG